MARQIPSAQPTRRCEALVAAGVLLGAIATVVAGFMLLALLVTAAVAAPGPVPAGDLARDRAAIRGMAGEFEVTFRFIEVEALRPGAMPATPVTSVGWETVVVIRDEPEVIELQHLLLDPESGRISKHWRQRWEYEPAGYREYAGDWRFRWRALPPADIPGSWVQTVYQVDDSPRYASHGRFVHAGEVSTWRGSRTWRPLPRREAARRREYDVLDATNTHVITGSGWEHLQENSKRVLEAAAGPDLIAREVGRNTYRRITHIDFQPAWRYWSDREPLWATVRTAWDQGLAGTSDVILRARIDGQPVVRSLLELTAAPAGDGGSAALIRRTQQLTDVVTRAVVATGD